MGVIPSNFDSEAFTPICNSCGVCLCWDIHETEYLEAKIFWDLWTCKDCEPKSLRKWKEGNARN